MRVARQQAGIASKVNTTAFEAKRGGDMLQPTLTSVYDWMVGCGRFFANAKRDAELLQHAVD